METTKRSATGVWVLTAAALAAAGVTAWARTVMAGWTGGNFPPLVGHLFVASAGLVAFIGIGVAGAAAILGVKRWRQCGRDEKSPLAQFAVATMLALAAMVYLMLSFG